MARDVALTAAHDARPSPALAVVEAEAATAQRLADSLPTRPAAVVASIEELDHHPAFAGPTVVVFGPTFATADGLAAIQTLARSRPDVGAILVARRIVTKLLKSALRAGVRDVLVEPIDATELVEAVEEVGDSLAVAPVAAPRPAEPGKIVTVFSTKGGVGTSVIAANLASTLAKRTAAPVALVDIDLQFGDAAVLFNMSPRHTIVDAAATTHGDREVVEQLLQRHDGTGVRLLPAPVDPALADQITSSDVTGVIEALRERCAYVVVDTPSAFNDAVLSSIEMSDAVVFVGCDDVPTVKNMKVGIHALRMLNVPENRVSLVLNRVEGNSRMQSSEVQKALQFDVAATIPADRAVTDSVNRGNPVVVDAPKSKAAKTLEGLADRVIAQSARRLVGTDVGRSD